MQPSQNLPLSSSAMLASILIYSLSLVLLSVSPIMAGLYTNHLNLNVSQAGWLLSIEEAGAVLGALLAFWLTSRVQWKTLLGMASLVAMAANVATGFVTEFALLAVMRFISGIACNSITLVAACLLARATNPDRAFGLGLLASCIVNALWIWLLNTVRQTLGYEVTIGAGALLFFTSLLLSFSLPGDLGGTKDTWRFIIAKTSHVTFSPWPARVGLAGLVLFGISLTMVWVFLERLGSANDLTTSEISLALGLGLLGSGLGALAPTLLGDAGNRVRMLLITTLVLFAALALTWHAHNVVMFTASVSLLAGAWNMGLAYYMAETTVNDTDGRYTRAMYIAIAASQSLGPALAAILLTHIDLMNIVLVSPLPAAIALILVMGANRIKSSSSKVSIATAR